MGDTQTQVQAQGTSIDWNKIIAEVILKHEEKFLNAASNTIQREYKRANIKFGPAFTTYLSKALDKYSRIKTILYRNEPRFLYEFYEFNDVSDSVGDTISCDSATSLTNHSHFSIVLGDGGSGKSMLMRHFFLNALQTNEKIPIFVELRYLDENVSLLDYIYRCLNNLGFGLDQVYFEYALKKGMFLILLDGYDEIKCSLRDTFFGVIDKFCDNYSENHFILSSRRNDSFISWQRFSVYDILPLTKTRALNMIDRLDYDVETKSKFSAALESDLFDKHSSFASNPLLLTILLMTFNQYAEIPQKLHVFYSYAFDTLYSMHDATKGGFKRELESKLSCDEFKSVFEKLSFKTYLAGRHQFSKEALLKEIADAGKGIPNFDSNAFFIDIQVAVCLVFEDGLEYIFTHRSFQEYFAASFICSLDDAKQRLACRAILKKCSSSLVTDKVFEMFKDMSEDRFEKNYIIPMLEEIESKCLSFPTDDQKYWYGLVDRCYISSDIDTIIRQTFDCVFPANGKEVRIEKGYALICVKFLDSEHAAFILSLRDYYDNDISYTSQKLSIEYWEKGYSAEDVWKDKKLRNHILYHTALGRRIRFLNNLLQNFKDRREKRDDEFAEMLEKIYDGN